MCYYREIYYRISFKYSKKKYYLFSVYSSEKYTIACDAHVLPIIFHGHVILSKVVEMNM